MLVLDEVKELYAYNRWANQRTLSAVQSAGSEAFSKRVGGSFDTLGGTLRHMLGAEWIWLERWLGRSPSGFPDWDAATFEALVERWRDVESAQRDFVEGIEPDGLYRMVAYRNLAGTEYVSELWMLLRHVVNHATYHRGQVTTLLRMLGAEPQSTDLVLWYRSR